MSNLLVLNAAWNFEAITANNLFSEAYSDQELLYFSAALKE